MGESIGPLVKSYPSLANHFATIVADTAFEDGLFIPLHLRYKIAEQIIETLATIDPSQI